MSGRPSFQFYPKDWRTDVNLRRCSPAARGVWMDVLCVLHDSEEYGVVRYPLRELANAAGAGMPLMRELVDKSVLRGTDKGECEAAIYVPRSGRRSGPPVALIPEQGGPIWYSKRLVKDEYVRQHAGAATRFGAADEAPAPRPSDEGTERALLRERVFAKTDGHCYHCTKQLGDVWEIDHLIPRAKGGRHIFSNLVPSCVACNQEKSDTLPEDFQAPSHSPSRRHGDGSSSSSSSSSSTPVSPIGHVVGSSPPPDGDGEPALPGMESAPPGIPSCDHSAVLALWREFMPANPQPEKWTEARRKHLQTRWRELFAEGKAHSREDALAWFTRFFRYLAKSRFLTGRVTPREPGRPPFVAELPWVLQSENFVQCIEGKYHQEA